jgi:hypothetical protein
MPPAERIKPERVRSFIEYLSAESKPTTVALAIHLLHGAAKLIAPTIDWAWLRSIKSRLGYRALPEDRFDRLVPPVQTLNFGIELMDAALKLADNSYKKREIQYRRVAVGPGKPLADTPPQPCRTHGQRSFRVR